MNVEKIAIWVAFMLIFVNISSITYEKAGNGNNDAKILYVGGYGKGNYSSIQAAIDDAMPGDTIFVYDNSSPYKETLFINKSLILIGENMNTTIIESDDWMQVIKISADNVKIKGFSIRGFNKAYAIIYCNHSNNIKIEENNILSGKNGIYAFFCNNISIDKNNILDCNANGIYNLFSNHTTICNNTMKYNNQGIEISHSTNAKIESNIFIKNNYGIFLDNSHNCSIVKNEMNLTTVHGVFLFSSTNNVVMENNIQNGKWGILIDGALNLISFNLISCNIISNQEICGIELEWSLGDKIIGNTISHNKVGLRLTSPFGAIIINNNFIQNERHAYFEKWLFFGFIPLNIICNNYWNRPHLFPKIIVGRLMPGNIPWVIFDFFPKISPFIASSISES